MSRFTRMTLMAAAIACLTCPLTSYAHGIPYDYGDAARNAYNRIRDMEEATQSIIERINVLQNSVMERIRLAEMNIVKAIRDDQNAMVAVDEKKLGGEKELTQAKLIAKSQRQNARTAAIAKDEAGTPETINTMCETAETTSQIAAAQAGTTTNSKAYAAALTQRGLTNTDTGRTQKQLIDEHNKNYCSDEDYALKRCDTKAPKDMQNADIRSDSLLSPVNGSTYSPEEQGAAKQFMIMATNPIPLQTLPAQLEQSAAGKSYVLAHRIAEAQMSVANFSLSSIYNGYAAGESPEGKSDLSMMGLLKKNVSDRFGNNEWRTSLQGEVSLQKILVQIALLLADKNFMKYQAYQQALRTETIVATQLAINARQYNDTQLNTLRAAAAR